MDNFMDKLAKRFNAGELIQANGEAEARENQRMKQQMDEYDKVIQEIRRLNLKTIEVSEQVSQMAACSIEQIEAYQVPVTEDDTNADYTQEFAEVTSKLEEASQETRRQIEEAAGETRRQIGESADETRRQIGESADETRRQVQESAQQTRKQLEDVSYHFEASLSQAESSITQLESGINQLGATLGRLELGNDTNQKAVESAIRNLEALLAEKERSDEKEQEQEWAKQIKEMIVNVRLYLDEVQKHVEDYTHKESVKVYRNVQAAMNEQLNRKARDLNDHMDQLEKEVQKNKGMKGLVVLAVLFSAASLALQILQMIGIL